MERMLGRRHFPGVFTQDELALRITDLPETPPDDPTTVIELTCADAPYVRHHLIRPEWSRYGVGVGEDGRL